MSMIEVEAPDGTIVEFPEGTPREVMASAMQQRFGSASQPERPQMGRVEAALEGVADGFGLGFNDEAQGLLAASQADPRPHGLDRFRDDQGNVFTDALGVAGDVLTAGSPMTRAGFQMATGRLTPEQQEAYEGARDSRRESLSQAQADAPWSTLGGQVGGGILNAVLTGGAGASPSIGRAAVAGAGYGGVYGIGSGEGSVDRAIQGGQGALFGGVTGAASQAAINAGGAAIRRIFGTARPTAAQIDDALARGQIDDEAARRLRDASDEGIDLYAAQARRDPEGLAYLQDARNSGVGDEAVSRMVRAADVDQQGQITAARQRHLEGMSPSRSVVADDALSAVEATQNSIQRAARQSQRSIDDAYRAADAGDGILQRSAVGQLGRRVRQDLSAGERPVFVDAGTPQAQRALGVVDELSSLRIRNDADVPLLNPEQYSIAGVRIQGLERVRQRLNQIYGSAADDTDRRAVREIIRAYDDFLDDAANARLLDGTDEGISAYQRARALFRQHRQRFGQRDRRDDAGRLIEEMLERTDGERLPQMVSALFGTAKAKEGRASVQMARRIREAFGVDSEEMAALRQGLFARTLGVNGDRTAGVDAMVSNLDTLLNGEGRAMASAMFTPEQISGLRRFYSALRSVQTPSYLSRSSGTAERRLRQASRSVLNSFVRGLPLVGETVDAMVTLIGGAGNRAQAQQALRSVLGPQGVGVPGAVTGTAAYAGSEASLQ